MITSWFKCQCSVTASCHGEDFIQQNSQWHSLRWLCSQVAQPWAGNVWRQAGLSLCVCGDIHVQEGSCKGVFAARISRLKLAVLPIPFLSRDALAGPLPLLSPLTCLVFSDSHLLQHKTVIFLCECSLFLTFCQERAKKIEGGALSAELGNGRKSGSCSSREEQGRLKDGQCGPGV